MKYIETSGSKINHNILQKLYDLILLQWEVWSNKVIDNILHAKKIVYIIDSNKQIIGCGCLKNREKQYLKTFLNKTGYCLLKNGYKYELWYLFIHPSFQNKWLWKWLITRLLNNENYIYAITRKNNIIINNLLAKYWFQVQWTSYINNQKELILLTN